MLPVKVRKLTTYNTENNSLTKYMFWELQMNKPETEELSSDAFMDKFIAECATQDWLKEKLIYKFNSLSAGSNWTVRNNADAVAACIAIATKQPYGIKIICNDERKTKLCPQLVSAIFDNAKEKTTVWLNCLDSFFGEGQKSQNCKELLTVCLTSQK